MKRFALMVLALGVAGAVRAQDLGMPAQAPVQNVSPEGSGKCMPVHAGDTVNYQLTINDVATARAVMAELQMRPGHERRLNTGLPMPDFQSLNGGGTAVKDAANANVYHFSFKVPAGVTPGVYRGVGVLVTVNENADKMNVVRTATVTRHTEEEIRHYCLAVFSGRGESSGEVVDFKPGVIERKQ